MIDANPEHVRLLRDPGLEIDGLDIGAHTKLRAYTPEQAEELSFTPDLVLLAVRSQDTADAVRALLPRLAPTSDVVSLQNGINEDVIASIVGTERTIGCVIAFGATWIEPGRISLDADGELTIGRLDGSKDERLEHARHHLDCAFRTTITRNVRGALWAKMLVNSMTVLGALGGCLTGDVLMTRERRRLVADIVAEGVDVATAEGVELPNVFGVVAPDAVRDHEAMDAALQRFATEYGTVKSVTWRDFEIGRATEIDAVTGEIVRRGEKLGVPAPLNACVYTMLREIEAGTRRPGAGNLESLIASAPTSP